MDHKPLIIANWKMNPTTQKEAEHLFGSVEKEVRKIKEAEIVICPPFVWLSILSASARGGLAFGSQDCFWEEKGAYTSQVSPLMLKNLDCQYVIIGHSERRKHFQESDELINRKIKMALKTRLRPILCLGEEVRDTFDSQGQPLNEMSLKVGEQLEKDLMGISEAKIREIVIAYEPIWAIGTGIPCSSDEAMKAALFIRKTLTKFYSRPIAEKVKILYGGSVTSQNAADYVKGAGMNGLLVGGASLNATEFVKIIEKIMG
ncbi:MAG: triose-phosphate isomerase [Candidatus Portnoybacteria bacterium]|nr:triose-phosphate isomerase [Candidatus Portnoybacteria bacterium]